MQNYFAGIAPENAIWIHSHGMLYKLVDRFAHFSPNSILFVNYNGSYQPYDPLIKEYEGFPLCIRGRDGTYHPLTYRARMAKSLNLSSDANLRNVSLIKTHSSGRIIIKKASSQQMSLNSLFLLKPYGDF